MESLIDLKETAHLLGMKPCTIYKWVFRRKLPSVKVGGRLRFRPSVLQAWLEARERPARSEVMPTGSRAGRGRR